jgi:hypothetical protein
LLWLNDPDYFEEKVTIKGLNVKETGEQCISILFLPKEVETLSAASTQVIARRKYRRRILIKRRRITGEKLLAG